MIERRRRRVVWSSAAETEATDAALWYAAQKLTLAEQFLRAVEGAAHAVAQSPELYALVHGRLRRVLVRRFPYALIVRETDEELFVVACYHLRRDPRGWKSRG